MALPTNITDGQAGHAGIHNDTNAAVNELAFDSGLRDISALLDQTGAILATSPAQPNRARIRRVGRLVCLDFNITAGGAVSNEEWLILPEGFTSSVWLTLIAISGENSVIPTAVTGGVRSYAHTAGMSILGTLYWITEAPVPPSLPGTPA